MNVKPYMLQLTATTAFSPTVVATAYRFSKIYRSTGCGQGPQDESFPEIGNRLFNLWTVLMFNTNWTFYNDNPTKDMHNVKSNVRKCLGLGLQT